MTDTPGEQKVDTVLATVAEVASVAGDFAPGPIGAALEAFSVLEPMLGPEAVRFFGGLFHKLQHTNDPNQASLNALLAAHTAVNNYIRKMPHTPTSGQLLGGD